MLYIFEFILIEFPKINRHEYVVAQENLSRSEGFYDSRTEETGAACNKS